MTMLFLVILICAIGWFVITLMSKNATIELSTAYAGTPKPRVPAKIKYNLPKRKVCSFIGGERIDLSKFESIIIKGRSLEKLGVKDNSIAYCSLWNKENSLDDLRGRLIILDIDNERTIKEHPMNLDYFHSNGKKARKVLQIVSSSMSEVELQECIDSIFKNGFCEDKKEELEREIKSKYAFASEYYSKGEQKLIMSLTYRNDGKDLGFSFHSPQFLYGVIEYVSENNFLHEAKAS